MDDHTWVESYARMHKRPPIGPGTSEALLADPHLRAVFEMAIAVQGQEEGLWDLAWGLSAAVSGLGTEYGEIFTVDGFGSRERWFMGYALGCQMLYAAGVRSSDEIVEVSGAGEPDESVEEWVSRWRDHLSTDAT